MTEPATAPPERRRHTRIAPKGTVMLSALGHVQRGRIANVGRGGVFVLTSVSPPDRLLARTVDLELRVDGGHAEWLHCAGRVVRLRPEGLAIAFDEPSADLVTMLDDLATASHARVRVVSVVLIDPDLERRAAIAAGFRATGCSIVEASTPLEAIVRLGESSFEPDVIAIADSYPAADAQDMRTFVERDHPNAKLVTIGDELLEPDGIVNWLSSADPDSDLTRRVREVLARPRRR